MDSQESTVDNTGQWNIVKWVHEQLINILVVLVGALGSEIEERCHLPALVVSSDEVDRFWEIDLSEKFDFQF